MTAKNPVKIGVIGGMGPAASALFYRMTVEHTKALYDQQHLDMILLSHASMPDRTEALLGGRRAELLKLLLADAHLLESCGADAIAIPCNTSHVLADEIQAGIHVPLINMVTETVRECAARFAAEPSRRVAVLATDGTVRAGIYQRALEAQAMEPWLPPAEVQSLVTEMIYDGVKRGGKVDYEDFLTIERSLACAGCEAALLACTELSVINEMFKLPAFYIDAMRTLVKRVILFAGKEYV
ncbi:MAG: amino acid racemase [Clostridiales Family XIII bacterium]|jgi:aspartate racemase|nr:amino acid racemase [Clostridiales Family XIII bacterium]